LKAKPPTRLSWKRLSNLFLLAAVWGCDQVQIHAPKGTYLGSVSDIGRVCPPGNETSFCIDGTVMPSQLGTESEGTLRVIEIKDRDVTIDREQYEVAAKALLVREAGDEVYDPPIDIIRIPMYAGDSWKWSGNLISPSKPIPARAKVTTEDAQVPYQGKSVRAVLTTVELEILLDTPRSRTMRFWVTKDYGIIKREFGTSIRQPKE
jgi:hypothetical protein